MTLKRHPLHVGAKARPKQGRRLAADPPNLVGFDVETDHLTGEPKLLTDSLGRIIIRPTDSLTEKRDRLVKWIRSLSFDGATLVSWRQFDHIALLRILIEPLPITEQWRVIERFDRIDPALELTVGDTEVKLSSFKNSIKTSIGNINKWSHVTVVDASKFYYGHLANVCEGAGIPYEKGAKELHLVDWRRYTTDDDYRQAVNDSNLRDAQVAQKLQELVHANILKAFHVHAPVLSSAGSACKTALASVTDPESYEAANWFATVKTWDASPRVINELWCMAHESYSGGLIDTYRLGYHEEAYTADIASAYPAVITELPDLRHASLIIGAGAPDWSPSLDDLTIIRGTMDAPATAYHTVSYANRNGSKSRVAGINRMTYTHQEREWAINQGCVFRDEEWIKVVTERRSSPIATACHHFLEERRKYKGDAAERVIKEAANSLYGVGFEMIEKHKMNGESIVSDSLRTGELYNPLYASFITGLTRIRLSMACDAIKRYGGEPIAVMTDSVSWTGSPEMIPKDMSHSRVDTGIRETKTTGYFEKPEKITRYLSLGTGRYEYYLVDKKKWVTKARGYRLREEDSAVSTGSGRLLPAIRKAVDANPWNQTFKLHASNLVSPGLVRNRHNRLSPRDLGRIIDEEKDFNPLALGTKRRIVGKPTLRDLLSNSYATLPQVVQGGDNTLPGLRDAFHVKSEESGRHWRQKRRTQVQKYFKRLDYHLPGD